MHLFNMVQGKLAQKARHELLAKRSRTLGFVQKISWGQPPKLVMKSEDLNRCEILKSEEPQHLLRVKICVRRIIIHAVVQWKSQMR